MESGRFVEHWRGGEGQEHERLRARASLGILTAVVRH